MKTFHEISESLVLKRLKNQILALSEISRSKPTFLCTETWGLGNIRLFSCINILIEW